MNDIPAPVAEPVALPDDDARALEIGATLIRGQEGCTLIPQPDTPPHWQLGYGCNTLADGTPVGPQTPPLPDITAAEALLQAMLAPRAARVSALVTVYLTPAQRGALYDFSWNEGIDALATSTLLRLVNVGDFAAAAEEFPKWVYAGGRVLPDLVRRRALERAIFLGLTKP